MTSEELTKMEKIISLCKRRGFVYQGSEIYGGLAGTWDYGPLGVALKKNIENLWWKRFVTDREDMYGMDAAILMNQNVWKASGHIDTFTDPLVECLECNKRFRFDHLVDSEKYMKYVEDVIHEENKKVVIGDGVKLSEEDQLKLVENVYNYSLVKNIKEAGKYVGPLAVEYLRRERIKCPNPSCSKNNWGEARLFNMMLKTNIGPVADDDSISYLRPETAGGMFVNFKNIIDTFHPKLPFGMAQIGKTFRNEISPRDFIFRVRELEQMEIEYFVKSAEWKEAFESLRKEMWSFIDEIGLVKDHVHELEVSDGDRAHYSKRTIDFEFDFPFGRKELYGLAYRTDFDLTSHTKASSVDLSYYDEENKERFVPHVIEPSFGVGRSILAVLSDAYSEDELGGEKRSFLKLSPKVAPNLIAVFPLLKNKPALIDKAREVYKELKNKFTRVSFDDNGNIGKRYRRQDEIGTPFCVTIDFDTIEKDNTVTVRNRDTGEQERVVISDLISHIEKKVV